MTSKQDIKNAKEALKALTPLGPKKDKYDYVDEPFVWLIKTLEQKGALVFDEQKRMWKIGE